MTVPRLAGRGRFGMRAVLLVLLGVLIGTAGRAGAATPTSAPAPAAADDTSASRATDVASVAAALTTDPLYVSSAPGTPNVAAGDVRGTLPPNVYVAVLPASATRQVGGEAAALPGAILSRLPGSGTVLVLVGSELDGATRAQSYDHLQQVLTDARNRLAAGGPPAQALVLAARDLSGSGQLSDPPAPSRAGSPSGSGLLWVVLVLVVGALVSIPILLRRARRPAAEPPPRVLRDRVEVDAYGRIIRRVTAQEQAAEQERGTSGSS